MPNYNDFDINKIFNVFKSISWSFVKFFINIFKAIPEKIKWIILIVLILFSIWLLWLAYKSKQEGEWMHLKY